MNPHKKPPPWESCYVNNLQICALQRAGNTRRVCVPYKVSRLKARMSSGRDLRCSACPFGFFSGWSHHEFGCAIVCRKCGATFRAKSEHSRWGPSPNERLPLYRRRHISKRKGTVSEPAGIFVVAKESEDFFEIAGQRSYLLHIECMGSRCPDCQSEGTLTDTLRVNEPCPKCQTGKITDNGLIEY